MTIRDRVLAVIASQPGGAGLQVIRARLHDVAIAGVGRAVDDLYRDGRIERMGHGRYRLSAPKQPSLTVPVADGSATDGVVRPPSLARLMAGR